MERVRAEAHTLRMDFRFHAGYSLRPLQKSLPPTAEIPNTGFRLFPPQSLLNSTQIPP